MKSIKFDDGYETFTINGDPERAIRFSARDANILLRYEKAMAEMKVECGRLSEGEKENASTLEELNQFIFDRIDYIFNSDVSRVAFGNQSPLTLLPDGRFLFEAFLEAALNEVAERIEQAGTDIGKRTEKYIGKYQEAQKRGQKYPGEVLGKHE